MPLKTEQITLLLEKEIKDKIIALAKKAERSTNFYITDLIKKEISKHKK